MGSEMCIRDRLKNVECRSHPTECVALLGASVSDRLSCSLEEFPACSDNFASIIVLVLAYRNIGRVARANFFKVMFLGEILSSCQELRQISCTPNVG